LIGLVKNARPPDIANVEKVQQLAQVVGEKVMRLELSNGERIADPDGQTVERNLWSVGEDAEFAIIIDDERGEQHFIQVAKESEGFVVEYREGERQYRSNPFNLETVIKTFQGYRNQDKSWMEGVSWTNIADQIGGQSGCRAKTVLVVGIVCVVLGAGYRLLT
jgi:hypothetical protein